MIYIKMKRPSHMIFHYHAVDFGIDKCVDFKIPNDNIVGDMLLGIPKEQYNEFNEMYHDCFNIISKEEAEKFPSIVANSKEIN